MRRRTASLIVLAAASSLLLTACDGELGDAVESALPENGVTLPESGGGDEGESGSEEAPADPQPEEPAPPQTEEPQPVETPAATDTTDPAASEDDGVQPWVWVLLGAAVIGLVAWLVASRRKDSGDRDLAAQADGQLTWVRSQVNDPLVRWRGQQLALPADQRDTDSEQARTWALIDQRLTSATTDLLTLESGSKDDSVKQSASLLRQAAETYRGSLDTLAKAVSTGDQSRITQASEGFTADTSMLDQARTRFKQAAKL